MAKDANLESRDTVALQTLAYIYREHALIYMEEAARLRQDSIDPDLWSIELMEKAAAIRQDYASELYAKARGKYQHAYYPRSASKAAA
jgi:hypothetical protein